MKSKDISLLVVVAIISGVIAVVVSGFIVSADDKKQSVEVVQPISSEFRRPSARYFNADSVNPTQEIRIQEDEGSNPFSQN